MSNGKAGQAERSVEERFLDLRDFLVRLLNDLKGEGALSEPLFPGFVVPQSNKGMIRVALTRWCDEDTLPVTALLALRFANELLLKAIAEFAMESFDEKLRTLRAFKVPSLDNIHCISFLEGQQRSLKKKLDRKDLSSDFDPYSTAHTLRNGQRRIDQHSVEEKEYFAEIARAEMEEIRRLAEQHLQERRKQIAPLMELVA